MGGLLIYGYGLNPRRYFFIALIALFTLLAFAVNGPIYLAFTTVAMMFFLLLIFDFMFGNDKSFVFDPDYENWTRKNE